MSTSNEKQYYVEVTRHTLQAVRAAGGVIEFCGECAIDQKAALEATLAGWSNGARVRAVTAVAPSRVDWHLSTAEEAPRHRTEAALRTFAATLPHGFSAPLELTTCLADEGAAVGATGKGRWLLGVVPAEALAESTAFANDRHIEISRLESATLARVGGTLSALRAGATGPVLLWDLHYERSHFLLVTPRGVEAVLPCPIGLDALFGIVQAALGLKMRGAAARLFFNDTYDFNEAGPRIASDLAPTLKGAISGAPAAVAFSCLGITSKQAWFTTEVARALGLAPFAPDLAKVAGQLQLQVGPEALLTADSLGLLHTASSHHRQSGSWHQAWSKPGAAAPAIEKAPAPAAPVKAATPPPPSGGGGSSAVIKNVTVTQVPRAPVQTAPASTGGVAVAVLPEVKPQTKTAPAVAVAAVPQPKTEAKVTAKTQVTPAKKNETPAKTATPPPPAKTAAPAAPANPTPAPEPTAKRRGYGLYIGIAAGVLCAALAGKFYFDAQSAQRTMEQEKAAAAEQMRSAEARAREVAAQAKAEAERIRREAEAARESAVALARQQAEEQTRQKISAELDAERIAKSPGILIVTTSPAGASVSIDGGRARTAPLSLNDIMPGQHRVSISMPGYEPLELTAAISGTKTTDLGLIQLERATGSLALNSTPERLEFTVRPAGISLGGAAVRQGRTPAQIDDLAPGDYVVTFTQPGWPEQTVNVTVAKRATAEAAAKFAGGAVAITSTPSGALVKRNGVVVGKTPLTLSELPPDSVAFELSLPNHDPLTLSGDIKEGQQLKLEGRLLHVDRIAVSSEIAQAPEAYEKPAPRIGLTRAGAPPEVKMTFVVWRDGTTRDIQVAGKVDKDLAAVCVEALSEWKFHPGLDREGRPINVRVTLPIKIVNEGM